MSMVDEQQAEALVRMRAMARRARVQGRRWYLRAVLLMVIAIVAGYRGGQMYWVLGIVMVVLATMCISLAHSLRKQGRIMEQRVDLMQHTKSEELGELQR